MWGWAVVGLAAVVALQVPAAAVVWLDARRLNLAEPHRYPIAIGHLLFFGWLLVPLYIRRRGDLPRVDDPKTDTGAEPVENDTRVTWQVGLDSLLALPTRLAFGLATIRRWLWIGWFVFVPSLMLGFALVFRPPIESYTVFALASLHLARSQGRRVTGSGTVDTEAEVLELHRASSSTEQTGEGHETGLGLAGAVRVRRVGRHALVRIEYEKPRLPRVNGFVVPVRQLPQVSAALTACGVTVSEEVDRQADWHGLAAVVGRSVVTLLTVGVGLVVVALLAIG